MFLQEKKMVFEIFNDANGQLRLRRTFKLIYLMLSITNVFASQRKLTVRIRQL